MEYAQGMRDDNARLTDYQNLLPLAFPSVALPEQCYSSATIMSVPGSGLTASGPITQVKCKITVAKEEEKKPSRQLSSAYSLATASLSENQARKIQLDQKLI